MTDLKVSAQLHMPAVRTVLAERGVTQVGRILWVIHGGEVHIRISVLHAVSAFLRTRSW